MAKDPVYKFSNHSIFISVLTHTNKHVAVLPSNMIYTEK